jgi:flavin reductase (DIM6/NTAB) family NADH-FMN oxidoreductase RutF
MTIHTSHPFRDPSDDPVRALRARLGGAVTLWTAGTSPRAGLTVSSVMVAGGSPGHVLALVDPDSDLREVLGDTGRAVVQLLAWRHRDLAEAFAGQAPAPGGPFTTGAWEETSYGPRLVDAAGWAHVSLESATTVGWSDLLVCAVDEVGLVDDDSPLEHRRGRYRRADHHAD